MNEKFPFDENMDQPFNQLPLPDSEQSWQKMKALLDEEENRRRPVAFWYNGLLWGILLFALATGVYFLLFSNNTIDSSKATTSAQQSSSPKTVDQNSIHQPTENSEPHQSKPSTTGTPGFPEKMSQKNIVLKDNELSLSKSPFLVTEKMAKAGKNPQAEKKANGNNQPKATKNENSRIPLTVPENNKANPVESLEQVNDVKKNEESSNPVTTKTDTADMNDPLKNGKKKDSVNKLRLKPAIDTTRETGSDKKYFFSAGIGIQQQIPLGDQGSVPYDVYGREASIADYIPSVFFRFHQEDKWFIMGEFRYGAPQKVNDFNYSQHSIYDTTSMTLSTTTMRLKKTYYHQLPISFNYYVKPGLSVGLGMMYSRFYGAVSEKEIRKENVYTQDVSYTKSISNMKGFTDSFLHKSQWHFVLNTDYQWKNFLLGLRFTKDVQPYIKYTQPDGMINEEKNYSLQVIFRWQFWKSQRE
jgi:hypothetical protein